jgi:hypothetical protein
MSDIDKGLKELTEIRSMMERSSKFLSLSGLSGIGAGVIALAGWWWAKGYLASRFAPGSGGIVNHEDVVLFIFVSVLVVAAALAVAMFFSWRLARRKGLPIWNVTARETVTALMVPLVAGGVFSLILARQEAFALIPSAMLLFYGMALVSAGKYTVMDVRIFGICQTLLGLTAAFMPDLALPLWAAGFGVLHIIYGIVVYLRYEK